MALSITLLVLVLIIGSEYNGAKRWINLGFGTLQPSEIAKFAVIALFAHIISLNHDKMKTFRYGVLPLSLIHILVKVPNVVGQSYDTAMRVLQQAGLNMQAKGALVDSASVQCSAQSVAEGTEVEEGTIIEVTFMDTTNYSD